jgi:hypothetical protein
MVELAWHGIGGYPRSGPAADGPAASTSGDAD